MPSLVHSSFYLTSNIRMDPLVILRVPSICYMISAPSLPAPRTGPPSQYSAPRLPLPQLRALQPSPSRLAYPRAPHPRSHYHIPFEVCAGILAHLVRSDLAICARVSRSFYLIATPHIWTQVNILPSGSDRPLQTFAGGTCHSLSKGRQVTRCRVVRGRPGRGASRLAPL